MFKEHPKGLYIAFFTNMGERFGFYTMMAILVLFLQAKYRPRRRPGRAYLQRVLLPAIYAWRCSAASWPTAPASTELHHLAGIIVMLAGYAVLAVPGVPLAITLVGLFVIAFGNGLFKGNLQALVGQFYDDPKYPKLRDTAFMIFYMGINIGAFFAPFAATTIRNWFLRAQGFATTAACRPSATPT